MFAEQDINAALINLLVKKGILTADDVASLKREVSQQATMSAPASTSAPIAAAPTQNSENARDASKVVVDRRDGASPLSFSIGSADFTPFGFVDMMGVYRSTDVGSGISTNFSGIPYSNTNAGRLSETRFSAQNSRLGLRVDSTVNDAKVLGYVETDFLGNAANTLNVTSNAATLRMRLYFADIKRDNWEFLAGQAWSLMTPDRTGIAVVPGDLFYTMDTDIAYQAGLVWARQPQVRLVYHAGGGLTAGLSLENPDQYIGGANGAAAVTLPSGFNTAEIDNGTATTSPNRAPDVVAKVAYDTKVGGLPWHAEVAGVYRSFEINTYTGGLSPQSHNDFASGTGGSFNFDLGVAKDLSLVGTAYVSDGGGRYIFGQSPDFVVNPLNSSGAYTISTLKSQSYIAGLEWKAAEKTMLYGYASTVEIGRQYDALTGGGFVGYGYSGSPSSQNKTINELTLGTTQTLWKDKNHGALQLLGQLSYLERIPWFVAPGAPSKADATMLFLDLRYIFP
ncbi:MAG TPA: hypothetical protein VFE25_11405 [Opitutaceae bacterium]|nr:hypothetical protein [Opitutaceae bacterium]